MKAHNDSRFGDLPESDQWLLVLLRSYVHDSEAHVPGEPSHTFWEPLLQSAVRHHIVPVLYEILLNNPIAGFCPAPLFQQLKSGFLQNGKRNAVRFHLFDRLLSDLNRHHIPVILLKGVYFAEYLYDHIGLRTMDDVDILVREEDLNKTVKMLMKQQYRIESEIIAAEPSKFSDASFFIAPEYKHFPTVISPDGYLRLEIHCTLTPGNFPVQINSTGLWERAVHIRENRYGLCPSDLINYLCCHTGMMHMFRGGLRDFIDLAMILKKKEKEIRWSDVAETAGRWKTERCLFLVFQLFQNLLGHHNGYSIPEEMIIPHVDDEIKTEAVKLLFSDFQTTRLLSKDYRQLWKQADTIHKLRVLCRSFFPSKEIMTLMYPVGQSTLRTWLYYPVRFRDLFRRYGSVYWKMIWGDKTIVRPVEQINRLEAWLFRSETWVQ